MDTGRVPARAPDSTCEGATQCRMWDSHALPLPHWPAILELPTPKALQEEASVSTEPPPWEEQASLPSTHFEENEPTQRRNKTALREQGSGGWGPCFEQLRASGDKCPFPLPLSVKCNHYIRFHADG